MDKIIKPKYDVIVVPGGAVDIKTKGLYPWVKKRLDVASDFYKDGASKNIIVTEGFDSSTGLVGADVMKNYLVEKGVDEGDILKEGLAWNTITNAYFSRTIHTDPMKARKLLVINNEFHMPRTMDVFNWAFTDDYKQDFETAPNEGINQENLEKRLHVEEQFNDFYRKKLYPYIKKGDLHAIHSFLYDPENKLKIEYAEFCKELNMDKRKIEKKGEDLY